MTSFFNFPKWFLLDQNQFNPIKRRVGVKISNCFAVWASRNDMVTMSYSLATVNVASASWLTYPWNKTLYLLAHWCSCVATAAACDGRQGTVCPKDKIVFRQLVSEEVVLQQALAVGVMGLHSFSLSSAVTHHAIEVWENTWENIILVRIIFIWGYQCIMYYSLS